jgi:hypothetical protein
MELSVATSMLAVTADRIFSQGNDAANSQIGDYSLGYLKTRVKNNYPSSRKVILQATRQMANDFSVISSGRVLGLGFKNKANAEKSEWVEATYKKDIFRHTNGEKDTLGKLVDSEIKRILQ